METRFEYTLDLSGLDRLAENFENAVAAALESEGEAAVADMKQRAPVSAKGSHGNPPGFMRDSTSYEVTGGTGEPLALEIIAAAPYSGFVDQGSRHAPAQPWFTPAWDQLTVRLPETVRRNVKALLR